MKVKAKRAKRHSIIFADVPHQKQDHRTLNNKDHDYYRHNFQNIHSGPYETRTRRVDLRFGFEISAPPGGPSLLPPGSSREVRGSSTASNPRNVSSLRAGSQADVAVVRPPRRVRRRGWPPRRVGRRDRGHRANEALGHYWRVAPSAAGTFPTSHTK